MHRRSNCSPPAPSPSFPAPCTTSRCASVTGRTRCPPSGSNPAQTPLHRLRSPGLGATRLPLSDPEIFPLWEPRQPAGCTSPRRSHGNRAGNHFPLASRRGFLRPPPPPPPFQFTPPLGPPFRGYNYTIPIDELYAVCYAASFGHVSWDSTPREFCPLAAYLKYTEQYLLSHYTHVSPTVPLISYTSCKKPEPEFLTF
jgi:hypothetical protein